jgi:DNA-binding MarR family transcriptional regulator
MPSSATPPTSPPPGSVERLASIIMDLQRSFVFRLSAELAQGEVSLPQYFLLSLLGGGRTLNMSEIAENLRHTTAAASGLVDRLENLDYLRREVSELDRRKVLVTLTPKGEALVELIRKDIYQNLNHIMTLLSPEEQRMWLQIYEKVHTYCQTQASAAPSSAS